MTKVCVGICTCQRPKLFERCLDSLICQENIAGLDLQVVVIDNDAIPSAKAVVERLASKSPVLVHYRHEPRRGIPIARNRALKEALSLGADWLLFVDDDQVAAPDCVFELLAAAHRSGADVVKAKIIPTYPEPAPFWCIHTDVKAQAPAIGYPTEVPTGRPVPTNGVLIASRLFHPDGLGLRFNEALVCEEDGDFFSRAIELGATLVRASLPVLTEECHRSRYSYLRNSLNGLSRGGAHVTQYRIENGYRAALWKYSAVSLARTAKGIGQFLLCPFFVPFAMKRFKFTALDAGKNLFMAAGMIGGLLGWQYEYYRTIDGN